jgi:CHASE1-domain containing sensor protein
VTSGAGRSGGRGSSETGRFTVRRMRSAISQWRASIRWTDILVASVVVALSLGLGAYLLARAQAAAHLAFVERAQHMLAAVTERLSQRTEDLSTLQSLLEVSGRVTRPQFRQLTDSTLRRHRLIYALEWLPLVGESERPVYEAEARSEGLGDYRFWEVGPDGKPREAGRRPFYVPIHYMEPPNAGALGFDIASDPGRWQIAETARDSGRLAASHPFQLVQDAGRPDASSAVVVYAPVYAEGDPGSKEGRRSSLRGFAVSIFRVGPLVDEAAAGGNASGLAIVMRDLAGEKTPALERPPGAAALPRRARFQLDFPVQFENRWWDLDVFALPDAFRASTRGAIGAASSGVLAALFGFVTVTSLRTISRLRRQAEKVGPYRLIARLGQGAMGVVWEARHALLRRPTAVKLLAPGTEGERALARFEREVQLTASLTHPSTIAIYDYGRTAEGTFYYAMELLRGINLLQLVNFEGPLAPARAVHFLKQACGALAEAHAAGLIHRDIKPANLMACVQGGIPDFLKVLDFGLVKDVGATERLSDGKGPNGPVDAALSQDGSLLGTPLYLAPEGMSDPAGVDARADIFALGGVGYFLLTGCSPFPGRTAIEVFALERQGVPPLKQAAPGPVPSKLEETLRCCLSFRREARPESAETLAAMLDACGVTPPWSTADAKTWWRERGPAALEVARVQREEWGRILVLSSDPRRAG